jgi:tetratricopeptide (TPR) repeat protein
VDGADLGGEVVQLTALRDLQRMIAAGRLGPDDLISRGEGAFKRLGDIAELRTFFQAAGAGDRVKTRDETRRRVSTNPGMGGGRQRASTKLGVGDSAPGTATPAPRGAADTRTVNYEEAATVSGRSRPGTGGRSDLRRTINMGSVQSLLDGTDATVAPRRPGGGKKTINMGSMPPPAPTSPGDVTAVTPPRTEDAASAAPSDRSGPAFDRYVEDDAIDAEARTLMAHPPPDPMADATLAMGSAPTSTAPSPGPQKTSTRPAPREPSGRPSDPSPTADASLADSLPPTAQGDAPPGAGLGAGPVTETSPERPSVREPTGVPAIASSLQRAPEPLPPPPRTPSPVRRLRLDADENAAELPRGRSRSGLWVGLVLVVGLGAGLLFSWPSIAPLFGLGSTEDPIVPILAAGRDALAEDTREGYAAALGHAERALGRDVHHPGARALASRAEALTAQLLRFEADDREAATGQAAEGLLEDARQHAQAALEHAEDAVRHSRDAGGLTALADAMRLTGSLDRASSFYGQARTVSATPSAELQRVHAHLRIDQSDGRLEAGRESAEAAVEADPDLLRARLLLARIHLADARVSEAQAQIAEVLERRADHPGALALRAAIAEGRPPAPPTMAVPEDQAEAPPPEGDAVEPAAEEEEPPAEEATEPAAPTASREAEAPAQAPGPTAPDGVERIPEGRDYQFYIRRGDERMQRQQFQRAQAYYQRAHALRRNGSEALTGLGFCAYEGGRLAEAERFFQRASRRGYAPAEIGLGSTYRRMGRTRDALAAYERYLDRFPNGPEASVARAQASQLRARLQGEESTPEAPVEEPAAPDAEEEPRAAPPAEPAPTGGRAPAEDEPTAPAAPASEETPPPSSAPAPTTPPTAGRNGDGP